MDAIRKALDLAREERDRLGVDESAPTLLFDPKPVVRPIASIRYTQTQVFEPSARLLEKNRIIAAGSADPAAAAYRLLRTQVLQRMEKNGWRSLAILSPGNAAGKTTTAINLAISLANDQMHTVLLVDFDLKRPTIAKRLGIVPETGSDDVLRGSARVADCLHHPKGFDRLVVLPARDCLEQSSEALAGPSCRQLVEELRNRYPDRIIIFDLPPILGADDALAFSPLVECGLIVVAEGSTQRDDVLRSMELMRNLPIVGTVLNRAHDVTSAYG